MREQWRPVVGYEGWYEVSDHARVRRVKRGPHTRPNYVLKPCSHRDGYTMIRLSRHNKPKVFMVHRLVAIAFVPTNDVALQVNHRDGVKTNNRPSNLEWVTCGDNHRHAYRLGLRIGNHGGLPGARNGRAKLTDAQVGELRALKGTEFLRITAVRFGVSISTVHSIQSGITWK